MLLFVFHTKENYAYPPCFLQLRTNFNRFPLVVSFPDFFINCIIKESVRNQQEKRYMNKRDDQINAIHSNLLRY